MFKNRKIFHVILIPSGTSSTGNINNMVNQITELLGSEIYILWIISNLYQIKLFIYNKIIYLPINYCSKKWGICLTIRTILAIFTNIKRFYPYFVYIFYILGHIRLFYYYLLQTFELILFHHILNIVCI